MNILFLDDSVERQNKVKSEMPFAVQVFTAQEAIDKLNSNTVWDYVFLDHDLGGEIYVNSENSNTGSEVARWIVKHKPYINNIVIHSFNPVGAKNIDCVLKEGKIYAVIPAPFWQDKFIRIIKTIIEENKD